MKRKKFLFYTVFFVLLFLVFYIALAKIIPGYSDVKLPVLSYVRPFSFVNQDGKRISEKNVTGKVYVAEYFFTSCKGICPKLNSNLAQLYQDYKNVPGFVILSHTVDPETDSVQRLKKYADSLGAGSGNWWFLTGRKDSLYLAARVSYLLDDPNNNNIGIDRQFIHTQFFALVDKSGRVRKICDGLKKDEIVELRKNIDQLLREDVNSSQSTPSVPDNHVH
jgi:protein SCO1/2